MESRMEIERKWDVTGWPEGLPCEVTYKMEQGYVSLDPTVRVRKEEQVGDRTAYVLCMKSHGSIARKEIEMEIPEDKFLEICDLIGIPLIRKTRKSYRLPDGHLLEVNHVDDGLPTEFWYAEIEYATIEEATSWKPETPELSAYLAKETTYEPNSTMGAFWAETRLHRKHESTTDA
jgi:adenylate cyclase